MEQETETEVVSQDEVGTEQQSLASDSELIDCEECGLFRIEGSIPIRTR